MHATLTRTPPTAHRHPERTWTTPRALALDASLSAAMRRRLLRRWKRELEARLVAADDGMPIPQQGERRRPDLRDVDLALDLLAQDESAPQRDDRADIEYDRIPLAGVPASAARKTAGDDAKATHDADARDDRERPLMSRGEIVFWGGAIVAAATLGAPLLASAAAVLLTTAVVLSRMLLVGDEM